MEFWGVEIKGGKPHKVVPEEGRIIHISQASLGESKGKANDSVPLYVTFKGQKIVLGTLSADKFPQIPFDLIFEGEFEVSHNWKNGSIYLLGYTASSEDFGNPDDSELSDEESEEEDIPLAVPENGKPKAAVKPNAQAVKSAPAASQTTAEPKDDKKTGDDDADMDEEIQGSGSDDDEEDGDSSDDSDDEEDGSDENDEETPKVDSKKRANDSAAVTPVPSKKAKASGSAQKTDGKKGGHTATPYPAKQTGKAPAKSPPSGGHTCNSCSKSFNSENALQSHTKAKHK